MHAGHKPRKRVLDKLLAIAIESISGVLQQMVEPWENRWSIDINLPKSSVKLKSYLGSSLNAIKSLVRACLAGSKFMRKSTGKILSTPERERVRIDTTGTPPHASPAFDADVTNVQSKSPVTSTAVVESTGTEYGKKTQLGVEQQLGSDFETQLDIKKYPENKALSNQSIFESESRNFKHDGRGETLNLIVDEDSCTSRNKDEISSQSTDKSICTMEVQAETKHQELRIPSTATGDCSEKCLDTVTERPKEVPELVASRPPRSASDQASDVDFDSEDFDERDTSWVKLAHIGHISDYHGYQRQHHSFVPLKYNSSVSETRASLENTLSEFRSTSSTVVREDADSDQEDYDMAILSYSAFQDRERKHRSLSTLHTDITGKEMKFDEDFENRLFHFTSATLVDSKKRRHECRGPNNWIPTPDFKSIETDPLTFWRGNQNSAKRPRRTTELNKLKKVSAMMLSEMYHTLRFIEDYNEGLSNQLDIGTVVYPGKCVAHLDDRMYQQTRTSGVAKPSESKKRFVKTFDSEEQSLVKSVNESPLKTMVMKKNYEDLHKQFTSLRHVPEASKFEALRSSIKTAIDKERVRIYSDEEIVKEEKSRTRIARGYKRKADQEKIEKKHHEDDRLLLLREFEYANRNKKASAAEVEMERFETRPIQMVGQSSDERKTECCQIDASCSLCKPADLPKLPAPSDDIEVKIIHNPTFRRVDLDSVQDEYTESLRADNGDDSLRSLMEMQHTLAFVEKYNKGMIR
ncbi:MAG: hypothetical protein SGBAC_011429 [Bacillariaceae sp.]